MDKIVVKSSKKGKARGEVWLYSGFHVTCCEKKEQSDPAFLKLLEIITVSTLEVITKYSNVSEGWRFSIVTALRLPTSISCCSHSF